MTSSALAGSGLAVRGGRLQAENITKRFGGLVAVDAVSLIAEPGQITALIGPNGAGKTTLFNCMSGMLAPDGGRVLLDESNLTKMAPHERAIAGLGRTFQRLEIFVGMSVAENLQVAVEAQVLFGFGRRDWRAAMSLGPRDNPQVVEFVDDVLEFVGLSDVRDERAGDLPTGTLRLVELGRALCTRPKVLLLDEPASGQDDEETEHLQQLLTQLAQDGLAVLLVEHDVDLVMAVSDIIYVMDFGRLIAIGPPDEVRNDEKVREAYLGVEGE